MTQARIIVEAKHLYEMRRRMRKKKPFTPSKDCVIAVAIQDAGIVFDHVGIRFVYFPIFPGRLPAASPLDEITRMYTLFRPEEIGRSVHFEPINFTLEVPLYAFKEKP